MLYDAERQHKNVCQQMENPLHSLSFGNRWPMNSFAMWKSIAVCRTTVTAIYRWMVEMQIFTSPVNSSDSFYSGGFAGHSFRFEFRFKYSKTQVTINLFHTYATCNKTTFIVWYVKEIYSRIYRQSYTNLSRNIVWKNIDERLHCIQAQSVLLRT